VANTVVLTIYMKQKNNSLIHHMVIYVKIYQLGKAYCSLNTTSWIQMSHLNFLMYLEFKNSIIFS